MIICVLIICFSWLISERMNDAPQYFLFAVDKMVCNHCMSISGLNVFHKYI